MAGENIKQLLVRIEKMSRENNALRQQLEKANKYIAAINTGNIDALVIAHKNDLKIYTDKTADKMYRILMERMHEGAAALNDDGTILYCNSYFAQMIGRPLQSVIGTEFGNYIDPSSKKSFTVLIKNGRKRYSQDELFIVMENGTAIPVLMSVNTLSLDNMSILSIVLSDITDKMSNRAKSNGLLIEKIIKVIMEMNHYADDLPKIKHSDYISGKLNHNYTYLANIFSEAKGVTIQQFILIQKIEKVKELLLYSELNLTEISYKLQYSSVAHLSAQFRKVAGQSPSSYKMMKQRPTGPAADTETN
jgi:PAS domain S-box-containing protein